MAGLSSGNKKAIVLFSLLALLIMLIYGLFHDLKLDSSDNNAEVEKEVGPTVSRLSFYREISGDIWELRSEKASRLSTGKIRGYSVDVEMTGRDSNIWTAWSPVAEYDESRRFLVMETARGTGLSDSTKLHWSADVVQFSEKQGLWVFPEGINVRSASMDLRGNEGQVLIEGKMKVSGDALAVWKTKGEN